MNVEIRTKAAQLPFWEYLVPIFGQVSLQCIIDLRRNLFGRVFVTTTYVTYSYVHLFAFPTSMHTKAQEN